MEHYGIIGYPLEHSRSAEIFSKKFAEEGADADFRMYPLVQIEDFERLIREVKLRGLNVTMPYKESIFRYLNEVDEDAKAIGAVNVLRFANDGSIKGYNTDAIGFTNSIRPLLGENDKRALVLGTGGASKAVCHCLKKLGLDVKLVSRDWTRGIPYEELTQEIVELHTVIVNTTPLGMVPDTESKPPFPYEYLTQAHLLYDLIYNPTETLFLQEGLKRGCRIKNGEEMLKGQAKAAWEIWNAPEGEL